MSKTVYGAVGSFCWAENFTPNEKKTQDFYAKLFGWNYSSVPMPQGNGQYTFGKLAQGDVCGMAEITPEMKKHGMVPHWASYVAVADVDATMAKAAKLGANIIMEPMDVMEAGRMAIIQDPTGAFLCLWKNNKSQIQGGIPRNEHGMIGWNELLTSDLAKSKAFYTSLFDWQTEEETIHDSTYVSFTKEGKYVGGMMQIQKEMGDIPSHWGLYFTVKDIEAARKIAKNEGATELSPCMDLENIGKMLTLQDPQGSVFSLFQWAN